MAYKAYLNVLNKNALEKFKQALHPSFPSLEEIEAIKANHPKRETLVPIPNTEVKPSNADGTLGETPRESRSP